MATVFIFLLIGGWFFPILGYFIVFCMILGIGTGIFKGRKWCDWFCPRGSFYDAFYSRVSKGSQIPTVFRSLTFRLGIMVFLMTSVGIQLYLRWPNFYSIGHFFVVLLTITTVIGITLGYFWKERVWCSICPIGTMSSFLGKNKLPLIIDSAKCTECKLCATVCPMRLTPYKHKSKNILKIKEGDCLKCSLCVKRCPKEALYFK